MNSPNYRNHCCYFHCKFPLSPKYVNDCISFQVKSDEPVQHDGVSSEEQSKPSLKHDDLDNIEREEEKEEEVSIILDDENVKLRQS